MGFSLKKAFKKLGDFALDFFINPFYAAFNLGMDALEGLFKVDLPSVPAALKAGKAYVSDLKQNLAQLGDVRTKIYGRVTDWPPLICSYTEFVNNEQVYYAYLHLTDGLVDVTAIRIGSAPLVIFPGQRSEVALPGQAVTLVHPNVDTSPDVESIDLRGSISGFVQLFYRMTFAPASGATASATRIVMIGKTLLASVPLGPIQISGTVSNNGTLTVTDRGWSYGDGFWIYSWLEIAEPLTTEGPVDCYLEYGQEDPAAPTIKAESIDLVFSNAASNVSSPEPESLADFAVGDVVRAMDTVSNSSVDFTVLAALDGRQLMLAPSPVNETVSNASLVLVRRRAGPFPVCLKGDKVSKIGVDFSFAALTNNGVSRSVTFEARWREIDDGGNPLGSWNPVLMTCSNSEFRPFRQSHYIEVDPPARVQLDMRRVTMESNSTSIRDAATWTGLRGYVVAKDGADPATDPHTTRLTVVVRSSGFLSRQQQRTINVDLQALLPVWDGDSWSEPVATRNASWVGIDWLKTQSRGLFTDEHIDLPAFQALGEGCDIRGDTFDAPFDREVLLWEGLQSILRVARAKPLLDTSRGKVTVYRDEPTAPTLLFGDGINCRLGPTTITTPTSDTPTGVRVKFVDPSTWTEREDGPLAGGDENPLVVSLFGCTSWEHAWREAYYQYADLRYRVQSFAGETEMEGLQARLGGRVLVGSTVKGWGQVMEVAAVDGLVLTLSHPLEDGLTWVDGAQHYVHLQGEDGLPTARINCTRLSESEIELVAPHGITLRTGSGWRTIALIGHDAFGDIAASGPRLAMVEGMQANGFRQASLQFRLDDARVHADPGPAPEDPYAAGGSSPDLTINGLVAEWVNEFSWRLTATWDANPNALAYEVQTRRDSAWTSRGTTIVAYFSRLTLLSSDAGEAFRVRAYAADGSVGPWAEAERPP